MYQTPDSVALRGALETRTKAAYRGDAAADDKVLSVRLATCLELVLLRGKCGKCGLCDE